MHHFYSLTFMDSNATGATTHANTYIGLVEPRVTRRDIAQARTSASLSANAVLLNCSYLGEMTAQQWQDQQ